MHTIMDLELVKHINSELTWSTVKRGRRSMRRPNNMLQDSVVLDYEKSGVAILGQHFAEEVLDVPIKKRILMLQHQTPSSHHEQSELLKMFDNDLSKGENTKQTVEKVPDLNDFSGIELLAAAACVEFPAVEEHTTQKADSYTNGVKDDIAPMDSEKSSVQNLSGNGNCEVDKLSVPSKSLRLHWDLNTVMDDWEEPCCDILVDPHSEKSYFKESCNDSVPNDKASQLTEDEAVISTIPLSKPEIFSIQETNDVGPQEEVNAITASVIKVESLNKGDDGQAVSEVVQGGYLVVKGDIDDKLTFEDRLSDCCGSNVSEDEGGHMAEGNAIDKVKSGYDSPVEDGELRESTGFPWEKIELEDKECVDYKSDNMYEDNFDTIETEENEITLDQPQKTVGLNNNIEQGDKANTFDRPDHQDNSQSAILEEKNASSAKFLPERRSVHDSVRRNGDCIRRSRSDNFGDSYFRPNRDFGSKKFTGRDGPSSHHSQWVDSNNRGYPRTKNDHSLNCYPRVNNRNFNTRPSPSDRNESYGIHRRPPASGISDRSRGESGLHLKGSRRPHQDEYNDPERKVTRVSSSFHRGADLSLSRSRKRSRSRSRSRSPPIAWHFQKKIISDSQTKKSPERFPYQKPKSSDETVKIFNRDQRFNNVHPTPRPARFPQSTGSTKDKFEVNNEEKYTTMNGGRRFSRYDVNPRGFRYIRKDNDRCLRDPVLREIPEKSCRYTTNKIFKTAEGDNLQRE